MLQQILSIVTLQQIIVAGSALAASLFIGLIFERVIRKRLAALAKKTAWRGDDAIIDALRGIIFPWFVLGGIAVAAIVLPFGAQVDAVIRKTVVVCSIFLATVLAARIASRIIRKFTGTSNGALPSATLISNIVRIITFIVGVLVILQTLGISITPVLTALGVGGLAVALALQDTLANLFAGIHILLGGKIRPGDFIRLESGEEGYVTDITWRNTTIRQLPNNIVVIPNTKIASTLLTNYYLPDKEIAVLVQVRVAYGSDLTLVERVTIDVARDVMNTVNGGIPGFEPFIRYHTFGDSSINFSVIMRGKEFVDQYLIKHEFVKRLHRRYLDEGIEIPFPQRTVHIKTPAHPSATTV